MDRTTGKREKRKGKRWVVPLFAFGLALLVLLVSCRDTAPVERAARTPGNSAVSATDDAGRTVRLPQPARRVVSLLPAGTETLFALGAGDRVVGRTRYDTDPEAAHLPSVGGGLDPSLEALVALRPDLVVAWATAGGSEPRERLEELGIPVFAIATQDTADVFANIQRLGHLVGRDAAADSLARAIHAQLHTVRTSAGPGERPSVLYVASIDPPIVAGPGTFIAELIGVAGGELVNTGTSAEVYWPPLSLEALVRTQPDIIMLPVGEAPASSLERLRREPGWRDLEAVRESRVAPVPMDLMNRPGPRIGETAALMREALRQEWGER